MGLPGTVLAANENATLSLQAAEAKRVLTVEWAKVLEREFIDIDFSHVISCLPDFPNHP